MNNMIPLNDLSRLDPELKKQISNKVGPLSISGNYVLGENVTAFERAFAEYVGATGCVSVANGTDALVISLMAMGLKAGDVVLNVANAGGYTTIAAGQLGAEIVFADIQKENLHASVDDYRQAFEKAKTLRLVPKLLVVTHLFGLVNPQVESIVRFAQENGLLVLEDCAQAAGARMDGRHAGTFGDIATISFYPTKNLGASGDAGAIFSSRPDVLEKARRLRQYGWSEKYKMDLDGGQNSRMDEIQAAVLIEKLGHLDSWNARRREIYAMYRESANSNVEFTAPINDESFVAHLVVVRHIGKDAKEFASHFAKHLVSTGIHYPIADNRQQISLKYKDLNPTLTTEKEIKRILTIPMFPEMTMAEVDQVCEALANA